MELTQGQTFAFQAVNEVNKSHPNGGGVVVINGYAGTGKTTLLSAIGESSELLVLAPTGKAALRAREVSPSITASTVHKWLYNVDEDPNTGKLLTTIKEEINKPSNKIVFVDEASMVGLKMAQDLYKVCKNNGLNLVFIGDSFQLPPVETDTEKPFSILKDLPAHYKVEMTEVVRQALDNPIIRTSMDVRDLTNDLSSLGMVQYVKQGDVADEGARLFDSRGAVLCHRNVTRNVLNADIRKALGYGQKIVKGEPLMVTFNNYEIDVYNGEIVNLLTEPKLLGTTPVPVRDRWANETMNMWFYESMIETPEGKRKVIFTDTEVFGQNGKIAPKVIRNHGKNFSRFLKIEDLKAEGITPTYKDLQTLEGDPIINSSFGYTLTAHKAQGSEFPETLVIIEPSIKIHSMEGRRWLYTALTRAKKSVKLCWYS